MHYTYILKIFIMHGDVVISYLIAMGNSMIKERRPKGCLFFYMGMAILVRRHLYIETGPLAPFQYKVGIHDNWLSC